MQLKLGKKPASYDRRDLLFTDFRKGGAQEQYTPAAVGFAVDRTQNFPWGIMGNGPEDDNSLPTDWSAAKGGAGDCTCADSVHRVMYANHLAGTVVNMTSKQAIDLYIAIAGYDPTTGANDNGADMRNVLNYCYTTGVTDADGNVHKIGGFCALQAGDWTQMLEALEVFDVVSIGIEFPQSAMDQFNAGQPWTYVASSPIEGGHDIMIATRPGDNLVDVVTWAKLQGMTQEFYAKMCDEAFGVFLPESMTAGKSPEGFDMDQFKTALASL